MLTIITKKNHCLFICLLTVFSGNIPANAVEKNLCVFDLLGANGPVFSEMKNYQAAALDWGVELELKPYTSERVAAEDFKSGVCDSVSFTGIRARQFNHFSGSLDAVGAMPSYEHLKSIIATLSSDKAEKLMQNDPFEVAAIFPLGAVYLFVRDRNFDNVSELAGKRFAIMDSDPAQADMVNHIGAAPVGTSIANMFSKFNNGSVDITYGPAIVYEAMEMYKGLEPDGGVIQFSLAQVSMQILIRSTEFPVGYAKKSRHYALSQFDQRLEQIKRYESAIPEKWWIQIEDKEKNEYQEIFRQTRLRLREKGIYNAKMLKLMRILRCKKDPALAECSASDKE